MYSKIDSRFWSDEKILGLSSDARYFMLYLLTTSHRNVLGCYQLPMAYAQEDLAIPIKRFDAAWKELVDSGMVQYDKTTRVVLVKNFLKYNPIENPKQAIGAKTKLQGMPKTALLAEVLHFLESNNGKEYLKPLTEALRLFITPADANHHTDNETVQEPYGKPFPKPFAEPYGIPVNSMQYTDNSNIFVGDDARAQAHVRETFREFLENRDLVPELYFGFTDQTRTQVEELTRQIYSQFSLKPPTQSDVACVFDHVMHSIRPEISPDDPDDYSGWRIEFPKDKIDLLMYAFEAAAATGSPGNWNYIRGVTQRLNQRGITTLEQAEIYDCDRTERSFKK